MIFNGVDLTPFLRIKDIKGRGLASSEATLIDVPSMDGAYFSRSKRPVRTIEIDLVIRGSDREEIRDRIDELNSILAVSEPVPITFPDEPNKTYYGIPEATGEGDEYPFLHKGLLTIVCPDPCKYGEEQGPLEFEDDAITINNEGTAEAYPIIEATAKESSTSFMITKGDQDYFMVGQPFDIESIPVDRYPEVARYRMESTLGWSHMTAGFPLDDEVSGGTISGSNIESVNGAHFSPVGYGSGYSGWYGPAVRRSFSKNIGNFSITLGADALNSGNGVGKVMAIFLDENDKIVCSIGLINSRNGSRNVRVLARMNDGDNIRRRRVFDYPGDNGLESTVFSSRPVNIRLRREGNVFTARTWQVRDGIAHARHEETIIDDDPKFQRPIRQVVLFFARYGSTPVFPMRIYGLRVHESNLLTEDDIPYICHEGDTIRIDSQNEVIMINDDEATHLKDFGSNYFLLDKGENHLLTYPMGAFDTKVSWRDRFK